MPRVEHQTAQFPPGHMLDDKHRIDRLLAIGGMGAVYVGTHTRIQKRVAIKVLRIELARSSSSRPIAYAAVPSVRLRLAGSALSVHAVAAAPVAFTDGQESSTFAAVAGGLGARYRASPALSRRAEALVLVRNTANNTLRVCLDGVQRSSQTLSGALDVTSDEPPFSGRNVTYTPPYFQGELEDIRRFARALPCGS